MAEKFLYLLGAGASAEALPLVKQDSTNKRISLSNAMKNMAVQIESGEIKLNNDLRKASFNELAENLKWLAVESEKFNTVDTYAKYLYIKDKKLLSKLKYTLSAYFTIEQKYHNKLDKRYLVWLTSILDRDSFPDNVKILSWNYDFQVELTAEIFREEIYEQIHALSKQSPLIEYYPHTGILPPTVNEISLMHLNGIAGFYPNGKLNENTQLHAFLNHAVNNDEKYIDKLFANKDYNIMNFAWEKEYQAEAINIINELTKSVTILIVIGYSFPFFNRDVDKVIFKALNQGTLRKIYFQDPNRNGQFLYNQFGLLPTRTAVEHIPETSAFYIPFEM